MKDVEDEAFEVPDLTVDDEEVKALTDAEDGDDEEEFDFSKFYEDTEEDTQEETSPEELGLHYEEQAYEEVLDLHSDQSTIAIKTEYPYIRIKGFLIKDEIAFMRNTLDEYIENIKSKYRDEDMLDIMLNINDEDYRVGRVPLNLDTFLTIFKAHRYEVTLVRDEVSESLVTSELMKAFLFT